MGLILISIALIFWYSSLNISYYRNFCISQVLQQSRAHDTWTEHRQRKLEEQYFTSCLGIPQASQVVTQNQQKITVIVRNKVDRMHGASAHRGCQTSLSYYLHLCLQLHLFFFTHKTKFGLVSCFSIWKIKCYG